MSTITVRPQVTSTVTVRIKGVGAQGPQGAGAVWGSVTGTLADQTDLQTELDTKLAKVGGEYTGVVETQVLTHDVTGAAQTITLNYAAGQTQYINASSGDAFTIAFSNWPTTEAGSMTLIVEPDAAITVGAPTWPTTKNTAPDFTGITAGTGYGIYEIYFANGNYYVFTVEEA